MVIGAPAVRSGDVGMPDDGAGEHPGQIVGKAEGGAEVFVVAVRCAVHEVHDRSIGMHVEQYELDRLEAVRRAFLFVGERVEGSAIGEDDRAVRGIGARRGVDGVEAERAAEFGDVVDAVAVDIGWIGDAVLLDAIALGCERGDVFEERRCAVEAERHSHRRFQHCAVAGGLRGVEHEVVADGGFDGDGHGVHFYRNRLRGIFGLPAGFAGRRGCCCGRRQPLRLGSGRDGLVHLEVLGGGRRRGGRCCSGVRGGRRRSGGGLLLRLLRRRRLGRRRERGWGAAYREQDADADQPASAG